MSMSVKLTTVAVDNFVLMFKVLTVVHAIKDTHSLATT